MKKSLLLSLSLLWLIFLAWCASDQQVELLQQQNDQLRQELQQQQNTQASDYETTTDYSTRSTNTYDSSTSNYDNSSSSDTYDNSYDDTSSCCKICTKWKACGDSCINVNYTCHKWPWCACDG